MNSALAADFLDVPSSHPNIVAIDYLTTEGIVAGYPDGYFRPNQLVNRAEALKIILLASGITVLTTPQDDFPDVPQEAWFAPFVFSARERGIASGYPDGFFRPEQTVNLVEALKMLLTANKVNLSNYATDRKLFADTESSAWYNSFLTYADKFEVIEPNSENYIIPAGPLTRGKLADVIYRFLTRADRVCPRLLENIKTTATEYFENISLAQELPNIFYENEIYLLSGSVTGIEEQTTTVFFTDEHNTQTAFSGDITAGSFAIPIEFHAPSFYHLSVIPGTSGKSFAVGIEVLPSECAPATVDIASQQPTKLTVGLENNSPVFSWDNDTNNLVRIVLRQGERRFERLLSGGQAEFRPDPADFSGWDIGAATWQIFGSYAEDGVSYAPRTRWAGSSEFSLSLTQHQFSEWRQTDLTLSELPIMHNISDGFTLSGTARVDLEPEAYIITPAGIVETISFPGNPAGISAGTSFTLPLSFSESDTYILELNDINGLAVLNHPIYESGTTPLLPDFYDLKRRQLASNKKLSVTRERAIWLRLINEERVRQHLSALRLDQKLNILAQNYAEDMIRENFFGHTDPSGADPNDRRITAGISLPVGENLAKDTATEFAHAGLMRSAGHRANILNSDWTRVGLGIAKNTKGELFFVQEFSTELLDSGELAVVKSELLSLINSARQDRGIASFQFGEVLNNVAQGWSDKMLDTESPVLKIGADSLENAIRDAGWDGAYGISVIWTDTLESLTEKIQEDENFFDATKINLAVGLVQGADGLLRATLIYY